MPRGVPRNPKEQRRDNAYRILKIIRMSEGDVSRKTLNEKSGLSYPSVNEIVNYLGDFGLISTFEGEGVSRRKVPCYRFTGTNHMVLGLTIVPKRAVGICADLEGGVSGQFELEFEKDFNTFFESLANGFETLLRQSGRRDRPVLAMGISAPGLIDSSGRKVIYSDQFPELENFDLTGKLIERLGIQVFLEHNPNLSAYCAGKLGAARDLNIFLYIILDKGIGGSLIYDGKVFRGDSPFIGELGHSTVEIAGDFCSCGNRGCLEMLAGGDVLDGLADQSLSGGEPDSLLKRAAEAIGIAVGNLICFLGVRNVVFGGRTIKMHPSLFYMIRQVLLSRTLPLYRPELDIRKSLPDDTAPPLGAALWAGEIALSNLSSLFFGKRAPELPLRLDSVIKDSI